MSSQEAKRAIGLIPRNYFVSDLKIFNKTHLSSVVLVLLMYSVVKIRVTPRGNKSHLINSLQISIFHLKVLGDIFMFVKYCLFYSSPKRH